MSRPQQQLWWLSIYLSLLALCIHASEVSTEVPNGTFKSTHNDANGDENYEVIDVSQTSRNGDQQSQSGQTTRIFTTGDVDDNFWLKHLGEDFKYAIHLQVGDSDRYDGVYNMTEDGSNYDIQHDYRIKEIPVDGKEIKKQIEPQTQQQKQQKPNKHQTADTTQNIENTPKEESRTSKEQVVVPREEKNDDHTVVKNKKTSENEFEQIFTIDDNDGMSLIKKLQSIQKIEGTQNKTPKIQNINIKYTPKQKTETQKDTNSQKENVQNVNIALSQSSSPSWNSPASSASPIVVTLPHDEKAVHQFADENTPVIVKMPPVIYHHNTNYDQLSTDVLMNAATQTQHDPNGSQQNTQFTHSTHTNAHQQQQPYENTDFTQYNTHSSQQSVSLSSSMNQQQQHQQQQSYYASTLLDEDAATSYRRNPVFSTHGGTTMNAIPSQNPKEKLQKTHGGSIRFILRKPSAPYNESPTHNQISMDNEF